MCGAQTLSISTGKCRCGGFTANGRPNHAASCAATSPCAYPACLCRAGVILGCSRGSEEKSNPCVEHHARTAHDLRESAGVSAAALLREKGSEGRELGKKVRRGGTYLIISYSVGPFRFSTREYSPNFSLSYRPRHGVHRWGLFRVGKVWEIRATYLASSVHVRSAARRPSSDTIAVLYRRGWERKERRTLPQGPAPEDPRGRHHSDIYGRT